MLQASPGETAPDSALPGTAGDGVREYRLTDHLDDGAVVLTFPPFEFDPVCTAQRRSRPEAEWRTADRDRTVWSREQSP